MLEPLARRGLEAVGIDRSPAMVELARARGTEVVLADMTDFDLGRTFDGAVCPIDTLAHLTPVELMRHPERMGRHLRPGARYLVQLQIGGEAHSGRPRGGLATAAGADRDQRGARSSRSCTS